MREFQFCVILYFELNKCMSIYLQQIPNQNSESSLKTIQ